PARGAQALRVRPTLRETPNAAGADAVLRPPPPCACRSLRRHERIPVVGRRDEVLLDRARRDPAQQVERRARLVVGAAGAAAAEGLLADDGARGLVVDVEVAGGVTERGERLADRAAVTGKHGAGQAVRRRLVHEPQDVGPRLVIDVRGDDGPEDLLAHEAVLRILREHQRRLDEPALLVAVLAAGEDLRVGGLAGVIDVRSDLAERLLVDHRAHEVAEVARIAHADVLDHGDHALPHVVPHGARDVDAGDGAALLPLVLVTAADDGNRQRLGFRALVGYYKFIPAGLADVERVRLRKSVG